MCRLERGAGLLDETPQPELVEAPLEHLRLERTPAHVTHHQVGAVGLAPVVVQRDDVRMLQHRHCLRLGLEAMHEVGMVGQLGADLLHRDRSAERRLHAAPHQRERSLPDDLVEPVAAQVVPTVRRRRQLRIVFQDLMLEPAELG